MFDLQALVQPLIPHIQSAADVANQWGQTIVTRLDQINANVAGEPLQEYRQRVSVTIDPTLVGIDRRKVVGEVPAGHEWMLEYWFANLSTPGSWMIRASDEVVFGKVQAGQFDSGGGNMLSMEGRSTISVEGGGGTAGRVYLQFKRYMPDMDPRRFAGGEVVQTPANGRAIAPPNRHLPPYPLDRVLYKG